MKILQSELDLARCATTLEDNTDMLADLYEIRGPHGMTPDANAIVTFNHRLAQRVRRKRIPVA
jgi:hypothetical protein